MLVFVLCFFVLSSGLVVFGLVAVVVFLAFALSVSLASFLDALA
jgi:hypothetical protein